MKKYREQPVWKDGAIELPKSYWWPKFLKCFEKISSVKIRAKKNRNNIHSRGRQDRRHALSRANGGSR